MRNGQRFLTNCGTLGASVPCRHRASDAEIENSQSRRLSKAPIHLLPRARECALASRTSAFDRNGWDCVILRFFQRHLALNWGTASTRRSFGETLEPNTGEFRLFRDIFQR